jgi:DNA-directed RNA polymerase subunit RPC12/RpoP
MIFVYVCSTCSVVELKTRFETWITRNNVNGVNLFHLSYLITLTSYLCSQLAPNVQIRYVMCNWSIYRLFVLNTGWKRDSLQMMIFVYVCSTCSVVELKTSFETWITRNDVNCVNLFHLSYLITLTAYLCLQWAPNVQIKYWNEVPYHTLHSTRLANVG